jgi:hypothetical protein
MATDIPFVVQGNTVNVAITTGSLRAQYNFGGASDRQVRILNASDVLVYVEFGGPTVVASVATSMPIDARTTEVLGGRNVQGNTHIAVISETASTKKLYATPGDGF